MSVACSTATFGISNAVDALSSGIASCVLVVNTEFVTPQINYRDRDSHFIFGDVATAVVVEKAETATGSQQFKILDRKLKTSFSNNIRNNFGFLNRCEEGGNNRDKLFMQQGRKVFKEVVPMVAKMITDHLSDQGLSAAEVRRLWLHQANLNMNQLISRKVYGREATADEAPITLDEFANTSSAGSIIAFHKYSEDLQTGDRGVICSFGAGYSVGSVLVEKV